MRGVDLIGTPLAAFGKIIATDDQVDVFNGVCGAESGGVPVSASSPSLLVGEVEVQKKAQSQETGPILPAPPVRKSEAISYCFVDLVFFVVFVWCPSWIFRCALRDVLPRRSSDSGGMRMR